MTWPFSTAELTAGLRRYLAEPTLQVAAVAEEPVAPALSSSLGVRAVRGLRVSYSAGESAAIGATYRLDCVLKELDSEARPGLANPGVREAGVYRSLRAQLPVATPALIAADPAGSWLVLEAVDAAARPLSWTKDETYAAIQLLARLHERFWGLADDLAAYAWLARPLTIDFDIHVYAAAKALGRLAGDEWPPLIARSPQILGTLGQIIRQAEKVVQPLRAVPFTLLHGGFGPRTLLRDDEGDPVVLDWHQAGIGPGVLDLVAMVIETQWAAQTMAPAAPPPTTVGPMPPVPAAKQMARYRREIARAVNVRWTDSEWSELWDHALLWRFMQETLPWLASATPEEFAAREQQFDEVWLRPVLAAASRRLAPFVYP
jgi:hypothetical protein